MKFHIRNSFLKLLYLVEWCPQNSCLPGTKEYDLIRRCNQVKTRSHWSEMHPKSSKASVPVGGRFGQRERYNRRRPCDQEDRLSGAAASQGTPQTRQLLPETRGRPGTGAQQSVPVTLKPPSLSCCAARVLGNF